MEPNLGVLVNVSDNAGRLRAAADFRAAGGKVVGVLCSYVPEEIIHAAGMLPVRIIGSWTADTSLADFYRPKSSCPFCTHVLQSLLSGELDVCTTLVATNWDQDLVRLADVWQFIGREPAPYVMHVPHDLSRTCLQQFVKEVRRFCRYVEELGGKEITAESLANSIGVYDTARRQLREVYDLRKRPEPPLSGAEALGLVLASSLIPKEQFIAQLDSLLPYFRQGTCPTTLTGPRLLVTSDRLDNPAYLRLVEETGCVVAMDDLDSGSRYFWNGVGRRSGSLDELLEMLAIRYLTQPASPRMMNWREQAQQIERWAHEFLIDGILELPLAYSRPREMRARFLQDALTAAGLPLMSFRRDYDLAGVEQLRTRVGAFVELLPRSRPRILTRVCASEGDRELA